VKRAHNTIQGGCGIKRTDSYLQPWTPLAAMDPRIVKRITQLVNSILQVGGWAFWDCDQGACV